MKMFVDVSIHAPVKGATGLFLYRYRVVSCFNPRAREGRDAASRPGGQPCNLVSIHAPVKGAT